MEHLNSIRAALRGAAPVVAIPVPGHAPVCIKAKLLKGALKGVTIDSVEITETRWLKIKGHAGNVHTSCSFTPISRYDALKAISEWSYRERKKRKVIALQGVLSASEQRALKLKQAEQAGIAELIEARKVEAEILSNATVCPVLTPVDALDRESIIESYAAYRAQRGIRKRASVIRWRLKKLREEKAVMVVEKREYEERPSISPFARRRRVMTGKKIVLRRKGDALKYAAILYKIGELEKQYESLSLREWRKCEWDGEDHGYFLDTWIDKRPKEQTYSVSYSWRDRNYDTESSRARLTNMAERLRNARANIRALTPPEDEAEELSQAA